MLKAIAIDDEPLPLEVLQDYAERTNDLVIHQTFTQVKQARSYLKANPVDLLFLDIHMPELSGIDFYKTVDPSVMVIFTTAHSQYAVEGFNLKAVDYLLKPFSYARFLTAVQKAKKLHDYFQQQGGDTQHFFVRSEYCWVQVLFNEILYIESFADYLNIHKTDGKTIVVRMPLKAVLDKLPPKEFVRVHRSYAVPLKQIQKVRKKTIYLSGKEIPIGNTYEQEFFSLFNP